MPLSFRNSEISPASVTVFNRKITAFDNRREVASFESEHVAMPSSSQNPENLPSLSGKIRSESKIYFSFSSSFGDGKLFLLSLALPDANACFDYT